MSAPFAIPGRAPRRRIALAALLTVLVALVASGCGVDKPRILLDVPEGMPASIDYLPGDSMGWVLFDTDTDAKRWGALDTATGSELAANTNDFFARRLFGSEADVATDIAPWVGDTGGVDLVTSDVDAADATIGFYDVAHRDRLEAALKRHGFTERAGTDLGDGPAGDLTYWDASTKAGSGSGSLPAVGVGDHALVYASTKAGLVNVLHKAHQLRAIERRGTNRFTALAVKTTPLAIVYRGDSVRDQLLRLVRDDPSSLELARWLATMSVVSASRDGWVGVAPPIDRSRRAVRLVGAFEWSKGQSQIGEPTPVKRVVLDELPASTSVAVAVDDPGSYVEDFLGAATRRGYNFATKLDVPKGEPHVNALKLLGQLDGPSAMSLTATGRVSARIHVRSSRKAVAQVEAAARLFGLEDALEVTAVTQGQVEIAYEAAPLATAKGSVLRNEGGEAAAGVTDPTRSEESDAVTSTATLGTDPTFTSAFQAAGAPPRLPVAWFYSRTSCVEEEAIAGWLTWDKDKRMTWALDVPLGAPTLVTRCALRAAVGIDAARHDPGADGASTGPMTSAEMQAQLPSTNAMIALIARLRGPSADQIGSPVDVTIQ